MASKQKKHRAKSERTNIRPAHSFASPSKATQKKILLWVIVLLSVAAISVITTFLIIGLVDKGEYEHSINNYLDIRHNGNIPEDNVKALAPEEYWQYIQRTYDTGVEDFMDKLQDITADNADRYREEYGEDYTVSYDASDIHLVNTSALGYVEQYLYNKYNITADRVVKAYTLVLDVTIAGSSRQNTQQLTGYCVILIGDQWYLVKADLDKNFTTVFFTPDLF